MYKPKSMAPFSELIIILYKFLPNCLKQLAEKYLVHYEGGYYWSSSVRKIYLKYYGLNIGIGSYGCFKPKNFPKGTIIGNYCSIARGVIRLNANHPYQYATMSPIAYDTNVLNDEGGGLERNALIIGHDVWVGYNAIITKSCKIIGNGAVIGAGSIVTKDVQPYTIVAGNPAKVIKKRFDEKVIEQLESSNWFNMPPWILSEIIKYVKEPELFAMKATEIWSNYEYK